MRALAAALVTHAAGALAQATPPDMRAIRGGTYAPFYRLTARPAAGGAASLGARDTGDYAAFMRYAFRQSLRGAYTVHNLGFRCARGLTPGAPR